MYKSAIYPGSFDPITYGHIDIIQRASKMYDKIIVAVLVNKQKNSLFSLNERCDMIKESLKKIDNVEVDSFSGLLADYCDKKQIYCVIRGLRAISDFESELQMANLNKALNNNIETIFLSTGINYSYISSSSIKEIANFNGCVKDLVPEIVVKNLKRKFGGES